MLIRTGADCLDSVVRTRRSVAGKIRRVCSPMISSRDAVSIGSSKLLSGASPSLMRMASASAPRAASAGRGRSADAGISPPWRGKSALRGPISQARPSIVKPKQRGKPDHGGDVRPSRPRTKLMGEKVQERPIEGLRRLEMPEMADAVENLDSSRSPSEPRALGRERVLPHLRNAILAARRGVRGHCGRWRP